MIDRDRTVLATSSAVSGAELTPDILAATIARQLAGFEGAAGVAGIGVGVAGVLDMDGCLDGSPNLPRLCGRPLVAILSATFGRPVVVDNDANVAALAEVGSAPDGAGDEFLFVTLGTGLGSGLVRNGQVVCGRSGHGCELGHAVIVHDGRRCACGNHGCLEAYVSETAVRDQLRDGPAALREAVLREQPTGNPHCARALFELADAGHEQATVFADRMVAFLGAGLGSAINSMDVATVVLGGGLAPAFLARRAGLETAIQRALFARRIDDVRIVAADAGPYAGAVGAARLAMLGPAG